MTFALSSGSILEKIVLLVVYVSPPPSPLTERVPRDSDCTGREGWGQQVDVSWPVVLLCAVIGC